MEFKQLSPLLHPKPNMVNQLLRCAVDQNVLRHINLLTG